MRGRSQVFALLFFLSAVLLGGSAFAASAVETDTAPTRYGVGLTAGQLYDPNEKTGFLLASAFALFDYDRVWPHRAPPRLRFRVEASAGSTTGSSRRFLASGNMFAVYQFGDRRTRWRPYAEAGIGVIYTDFRVDGQGLRVNFNPQAGLGLEWRRNGGAPLYFNLRLHHVSNGGLHEDNRGLNSVMLSVGTFF